MFRKLKKVMSIFMIASIGLSGCAAKEEVTTDSSSNEITETQETNKTENKELVVIKYGSHSSNEEDPNYKDPITNEYAMSEERREIRLQALEIVKEELGVDFQFVQYPGDVTEVLLQSVMAGDPIADIVRLYANSQSIILGQNVLQSIDEHIALLGKNPPPKMYGKQYFIEVSGDKTHPLSPLIYNIGYIEQVDALKENGKTVYPTDLYKEGKWTWSVFEDYLAKIDAHYANSQAPERPEQRIEAFWTDYTEALVQAVHSNGGSIYGDEGLAVESEETKQAVKYIDDLVTKGLLKSTLKEGTSSRPYNAQGVAFVKGESVFTNIEDWRTGEAAQKASERGQSLGFIPFPRPDHMSVDDPNYRQVRTGGESFAILKGVESEKAALAIQAFKLYNAKVEELSKTGIEEAPTIKGLQVDVFHPEVGQDMIDIYVESVEKTVVNELGTMVGVYWPFMTIAGDAIYGIGGSPKYDVAIQAKKGALEEVIADTTALLSSDVVKDNIAPKFTEVNAGSYIFAKGTDPSTIDWKENFTVEDNIDGVLDINNAKFDISAIDFNTVGVYDKGLVATIADSSENEGKGTYKVIIYDAENKEAPVITVKEEYRKIALEEDTSKINWTGDFLESVTDTNGLDISSLVQADLSELDTTTAGQYNVPINVVDYAGNTAQVIVEVIVE